MNNNLPKSLIYNNDTIYNKKQIADIFNDLFINIGPNLASRIKTLPNNSYHSYLVNTNSSLNEHCLTENEFKEAFFSLKINKSPGYDGISYVIKAIFQYISNPL